MVLQRHFNIVLSLSIAYFSCIVLYSFCVFFHAQQLIDVLGFLRVPILMLLYFYASVKRDFLYFLALFVFQIAYLSFAENTPESLFLGALASVIFRCIIVLIICKATQDKHWRTIFLTSLPILFVYLFLINLIQDSIANSYYLWIANGFLTAFLGGLAVTNYCYKDDQKSFWLLISALLFVVQIGMFFVNKFYIKQTIFLQLVILFYGISHFTFYKFMIFNDQDKLESSM